MEIEKPFYGYKIVIADFNSEMPIEVRITLANRHENQEFKPLMKEAKRLGLKASRICGDAIHDNKQTAGSSRPRSKSLHRQKPRKNGKKRKQASKTYRQMKASVERVFSRAKQLLNLENLHVRGLRSLSIWVNLVFTAMLAIATAAKGNGLENRIRCIRSAFG